MNRPRNRQPRPPQNQSQDNRGRGRGRGRGGSNASRPTPTFPSSVPTVQQVHPGASVSIVLKQDQPTGREVQGVVQDVLTRGNHPRGIKVRLRDGRVGRVQRMSGGDGDGDGSGGIISSISSSRRHDDNPAVSVGQASVAMTRDSRFQDDQEGPSPPPRTLADFLPAESSEDEDRGEECGIETALFANSATAWCPICNLFEGDEIAVSRHVDGHFT